MLKRLDDRTSGSVKAAIMVNVEAVVQRPAPSALAVLETPPATDSCFAAVAAMPSNLFVCLTLFPASALLAPASAAALAALAARPASAAATPTMPVTLPPRKMPALSSGARMSRALMPVSLGLEKSDAIVSCRTTFVSPCSSTYAEQVGGVVGRTNDSILSIAVSCKNS